MEILVMLGGVISTLIIWALAVCFIAAMLTGAWVVVSAFCSWWVANPPKDPVYDSSVRVKKDRSLPIIVSVLALAFVVLNIVSIVGGLN